MITGTVSSTDYLNAQRLHRSRAVRWYYGASLAVMVLGLVIYFTTNPRIGLVVACGGIGGLVGELTMSLVILPCKVRRLHSQQRDLAFPFTYSWDAEFIEAQGCSGHSKRPWKHFVRVREDDNAFLLYHSDNLFEVIPKRWFTNQPTLHEFRVLAARANET